MELIKTFTFDVAHRLTTVPSRHRCTGLHGRMFRVDVHLSGPFDPSLGYLVDFGDTKRICEPAIALLDHAHLNDVEGLENPTSENIAVWLWNRLSPDLSLLTKIAVYESPRSGVVYEGDR